MMAAAMATDTTRNLETLVAADERNLDHLGVALRDTDGPRDEYFRVMAASHAALHLTFVDLVCLDIFAISYFEFLTGRGGTGTGIAVVVLVQISTTRARLTQARKPETADGECIVFKFNLNTILCKEP